MYFTEWLGGKKSEVSIRVRGTNLKFERGGEKRKIEKRNERTKEKRKERRKGEEKRKGEKKGFYKNRKLLETHSREDSLQSFILYRSQSGMCKNIASSFFFTFLSHFLSFSILFLFSLVFLRTPFSSIFFSFLDVRIKSRWRLFSEQEATRGISRPST